MVWGNRSGYAVFGMVLGGVGLSSFGGCSGGGDGKRGDECGPGQTRTCNTTGFGEDCDCSIVGTAGTGPGPGGSGGRGGSFGGGTAGSGGTGAAGGAAGARPIIDGAIGSGGSFGTGASGGAAGSGGTAPGTGRLGAACGSSVDCGAGLTCLLATSSALGGEGPARGLCTMDCGGDAAACSRFGNDALCVDFGSGVSPALYCVQGCTFGPVGSTRNPNKCHGRNEVACAPLFGATGRICAVDGDCGAGNLCGNGECFAVFPACLPQCNADSDCGAGRFCNPQTGLCGAVAKSGLPLGEECTQPPTGGTDACRGTCTGIVTSAGATATAFTCGESCTLGAYPACNWSGPASGTPAPGLCLFSSTIIEGRGGPGPGDRGTCTQLCNCNADCLHPSFLCIPIGDPATESTTQRRGFCTLPPQGNPGIPSCTP